MKKILTGLFACVICIPSLYAQSPEISTMDLLTSVIWQMEYKYRQNNNDGYFSKYGNEDYSTMYIQDGVAKSMGSRAYYLSDEIEETFDENKIGKIKNGKYIISKGGRDNYNEKNIEKLKNELNARDKKDEESEIDKKLEERLAGVTDLKPRLVFAYEIISLSKDELILHYRTKEVIIGNKPLRYLPFSNTK